METWEKRSSHHLRNAIANTLTANGFNEALNNSLVAESLSEKWNEGALQVDSAVKMINPLSNELNIMRQSMAFGLLASAAYNQNRQNPDIKFYEFGKTYSKDGDGFKEDAMLAILISGNRFAEHWQDKNVKSSFYTLRKTVDSILQSLGLEVTYGNIDNVLLSEGLGLFVKDEMIGQMGMVSKKALKETDLKQDAYYAEFYWDSLIKNYSDRIQYREISKFPAVRRDLSLLIDKSVQFDDIRNTVMGLNDRAVRDVQLFDVYEGKNLDEGKKSYAISLTILDEKKTLTDKKVDALMKRVIEQLQSSLKAELRQ